MKKAKITPIILVMLGTAIMNVNAGTLYATSATLLESFITPALDGRFVREGITGTTDLAADGDDVYTASGGRIYRLPNGRFSGFVNTDWNDYTSVAALPDGYVYAANPTSIWRFNADLTGGVQYMTAGNITDLAANSTALYGISGGRIRCFPGSGCRGPVSGWNGFTSVTVGADDYVYAANSTSIWRFEIDLTGGIEYVTGVGGITDLSVDGRILYGTSGGKIYSFPGLEIWGPISEAGDFTALAVVPEPASHWICNLTETGDVLRSIPPPPPEEGEKASPSSSRLEPEPLTEYKP